MKPTLTPKDFFLHLAMFAFLYVSTFSFLQFIFSVINYAFPDEQFSYFDPYSSAIRWSLSILIVLFPAYIYLAKKNADDTKAFPEKKELAIRKWLIYFTLFVTGVTILIDLITLINTFLEGEVSTRFILKVISVFIVAATVFGYYLYDLKDRTLENPKLSKNLAYIVSALVLISIIAGFFIIGSPATQRKLREDTTRISQLSSIQSEIVYYWQIKQRLPSALSELNDSLSPDHTFVDPITKQPYTYQILSATSFKLCADFALPTPEGVDPKRINYDYSYAYPVDPYLLDQNWKHEAGVYCFERTIDPDRFPPITKGQLPIEEKI